MVYVHGATYPASTAFDLKLDGLSWMEYIAARGYDVYLLDLRGYGKSTRPKEMAEDATKQSADRARRHRREGHRHRGRFRARAPQHPARQPDRLVVGHHPDGDLHDAEQRQGRAAGALRAGLDPHRRRRWCRPAPARRRPIAWWRASRARPLADRRPGGQEGDAHSGRLVRRLGRRHLGDRSGGREDESAGAARAERRDAGRPRLLRRRQGLLRSGQDHGADPAGASPNGIATRRPTWRRRCSRCS